MPTAVKALAVLGYIGAALYAVWGLGMLFGGRAMMGYGVAHPPFMFGGMLLGFGAVTLLVMAAVLFFVAKGLGTGENWARILVTVLAVIGAIQALAAAMNGQGQVFSLLLQAGIAYYLWFNREVRHAFGEAK